MDNDDFVAAAGRAAGFDGSVRGFGVSRIFTAAGTARLTEVGTNGSCYWVAVALGWTDWPGAAALYWAPAGGYMRAKLLEDETNDVPTGDAVFDEQFVCVGSKADVGARCLTERIRGRLLAHSSLRPRITSLYLAPPTPGLHVRTEPALSEPRRALAVPMGAELFTVERAARALVETAALVDELEGRA